MSEDKVEYRTKNERANESMVLVLPLPPAVLSPNRPPGSRGGRIKKAMAAKKYRRLANEGARLSGLETTPWERATVKALFFHRTKRRRDDVNHLAMLKPAYDGIVDAQILIDDDHEHLTTLPPMFLIDKHNPRVELLITRVVD